ncbi:dUTP diphosphatase [Brevibacterium sp. ACRRH]|uniref:dUTP diphosphatase n=1 Tax=Brevibacterium sp. ACRRH TaxID=2918183 RepID=UPI001EF4E6AE|nr:dUTP diphosphatase [Brevibacterium sp. ACRRH]
METLPIQLMRVHESAQVPTYGHPGDAGADLRACIDVTVQPFERVTVPTGIALAIPMGYVGLVHSRSGLSTKHGLTVVNAPGTIDAGYRGEIKVALINLDPHEPVQISAGDRIAQLVIQKVEQADFEIVDSLDETQRGDAGFGSTGK